MLPRRVRGRCSAAADGCPWDLHQPNTHRQWQPHDCNVAIHQDAALPIWGGTMPRCASLTTEWPILKLWSGQDPSMQHNRTLLRCIVTHQQHFHNSICYLSTGSPEPGLTLPPCAAPLPAAATPVQQHPGAAVRRQHTPAAAPQGLGGTAVPPALAQASTAGCRSR